MKVQVLINQSTHTTPSEDPVLSPTETVLLNQLRAQADGWVDEASLDSDTRERVQARLDGLDDEAALMVLQQLLPLPLEERPRG